MIINSATKEGLPAYLSQKSFFYFQACVISQPHPLEAIPESSVNLPAVLCIIVPEILTDRSVKIRIIGHLDGSANCTLAQLPPKIQTGLLRILRTESALKRTVKFMQQRCLDVQTASAAVTFPAPIPIRPRKLLNAF